jgi:hypothetical protein
MTALFDPSHSAYDLSSTQIQSYLRWSSRLAWALALLIPFTALLVGGQLAMILAVGMAAILVFLARELERGKSEAAVGLLVFALARLLGGMLGLLVVPVLFALVEVLVLLRVPGPRWRLSVGLPLHPLPPTAPLVSRRRAGADWRGSISRSARG